MRPFVGTGRISWRRPLNSAFARRSEWRPPSVRSRSRVPPDRRCPVATGTARASTAMSAGAVATSVTLARELPLPARPTLASAPHPQPSDLISLREVFGDELEHVCHAQVNAAAAGGSGDVDQTAGIVRSDDGAAGLGDGVQLPLGEPAGDSWPLEAEGAAETAAVGDVRDVDHLVAGQREQPARLGFEAQLAEALAGVVVRDLDAHALGADQLGPMGQQVEGETGGVLETRA